MCSHSLPSRSLISERVCLRNGQQSFNLLPSLWGTSGISRANRLGPCLYGHNHRALSKWTLSPHTVLLAWAWASRQEEFSQFALPLIFLRESAFLHEPPESHRPFCLEIEVIKYMFQKCFSVYSRSLKDQGIYAIMFFRWQTWPCAPSRPGSSLSNTLQNLN